MAINREFVGLRRQVENPPQMGEELAVRVSQKPKKRPIALRFDPGLLNAIDAVAIRRGISRNSLISYWCSKGLEKE